MDQEKMDECIDSLLDWMRARLSVPEALRATATLVDLKTWPVEKEDGE